MRFHVVFSSTEFFIALLSTYMNTPHLGSEFTRVLSKAVPFLWQSLLQQLQVWNNFNFRQFFSFQLWNFTVPKLIGMGPLLEISRVACSSATLHWQNGLKRALNSSQFSNVMSYHIDLTRRQVYDLDICHHFWYVSMKVKHFANWMIAESLFM